MAESPGSPLSSIASEEFTEDMKFDDQANSPHMPPSKRRRTAFDRHTPVSSVHDEPVPVSPSTSISSDTSGELPNSPNTSSLVGGMWLEDDYSGQCHDQVTVCRWDGCDAGEFGDMDDLVKHIHDEHAGSRQQKKWSCEWSDCSRKGQTHASGYALRAHIRSHTREKPFYCSLPECDRSFTRSDALTKHMRTVHEIESLRPSDSAPKSLNALQPGTPGTASTSSSKAPRIKLKLSQPSKDGQHNGTDRDADLEDSESLPVPEYGPEMGFDEHELSLPPQQLYRVLRRQIHWAEKEAAELKRKWEEILEPLRKQAWREKEAILDDVINAEVRAVGQVSDEAAEDAAAAASNGSDQVEAEGGKGDAVSGIKEQNAVPADDESAPPENDVSMMDADTTDHDGPADTKPPVGLEVEPQAA